MTHHQRPETADHAAVRSTTSIPLAPRPEAERPSAMASPSRWQFLAAGQLTAATLVTATRGVFAADQESGGKRQRRRHHDELTFTQIDFPGAVLTAAFGINDRGQIVGVFIDGGGVAHGFCGAVSKGFGRPEQKCNGTAQT
jgi:hypothetical protein